MHIQLVVSRQIGAQHGFLIQISTNIWAWHYLRHLQGANLVQRVVIGSYSVLGSSTYGVSAKTGRTLQQDIFCTWCHRCVPHRGGISTNIQWVSLVLLTAAVGDHSPLTITGIAIQSAGSCWRQMRKGVISFCCKVCRASSWFLASFFTCPCWFFCIFLSRCATIRMKLSTKHQKTVHKPG